MKKQRPDHQLEHLFSPCQRMERHSGRMKIYSNEALILSRQNELDFMIMEEIKGQLYLENGPVRQDRINLRYCLFPFSRILQE